MYFLCIYSFIHWHKYSLYLSLSLPLILVQNIALNEYLFIYYLFVVQFNVICIALFTIQSLQSSFTGNSVSTIDLYIVET